MTGEAKSSEDTGNYKKKIVLGEVNISGLPQWLQGKESAYRTHRHFGFNSQVRKIPLEEVMATHSSILAWIIPWTEPGGLCSPWGRKELDTTETAEHCSNI